MTIPVKEERKAKEKAGKMDGKSGPDIVDKPDKKKPQPQFGDHVLTLEVELPSTLTDDQRKILASI